MIVFFLAHDGERRSRRENNCQAPVVDRAEGRMSAGRFGTEHGDRAGYEADQCDRNMQADNRQEDWRGRRDFDPCDNGRIQRFTC